MSYIIIIGEAVLKESFLESKLQNTLHIILILGCTLDNSHQEQMLMLVRYVANGMKSRAPAGVYEHCIKFIAMSESRPMSNCTRPYYMNLID